MLLFLSKLIPLFLYPLGLASSLLILALVTYKHKNWQKFFLLSALGIILLGGNRWVAYGLVKSLEWQYVSPNSMPVADAIVILGGGTEPLEYPRRITELNSAGDRVLYGAHLYKQGKAPVVLLGGGTITWLSDRPTTPSEEMASVIQEMGVPPDALLLQVRSLNTAEEVLFDLEILRQRGAKRIILVTSAMHMPRAMALFAKHDLEVIPAPTDFKVTKATWDQLMHNSIQGTIINFIPNDSNMAAFSAALKEYLGLFYYQLQGSI